jgi:light-harvesting protein B-800-850 alpha chain
MNQGRIWTVVHPTVGLPLLLGSVTVIALLVHYAVLSNTTWFSAYWNGNATATVAAPAAAPPAPAPAAAPAKK